MTVSVGDQAPGGTVLFIGENGPDSVDMATKFAGRKVVVFGLPGAFTSTCTAAHVPSFMRTKPDFDAKGVDEIICVAVNDPFVVQAWGASTGAADAGITMLADSASEFTKAMGMAFTAPPVGFFDRSKRYAMYVDNGEVKVLDVDENPGECTISAGESLLDKI